MAVKVVEPVTDPVASEVEVADPVEPVPRRHPYAALFALVATSVAVVDQATKAWALRVLVDGPIPLVGSFRLRLAFNDGAAFSLIPGRTTLVALLALVVTLFVVRAGLRAERPAWAVAFGLIVGGACGNLIDRVVRGDGILDGWVVDFFDLQWWPVFNVADVGISLGVVAVLWLVLREPAERSREPEGSQEPQGSREPEG